jgi:hypothetical protein
MRKANIHETGAGVKSRRLSRAAGREACAGGNCGRLWLQQPALQKSRRAVGNDARHFAYFLY